MIESTILVKFLENSNKIKTFLKFPLNKGERNAIENVLFSNNIISMVYRAYVTHNGFVLGAIAVINFSFIECVIDRKKHQHTYIYPTIFNEFYIINKNYLNLSKVVIIASKITIYSLKNTNLMRLRHLVCNLFCI